MATNLDVTGAADTGQVDKNGSVRISQIEKNAGAVVKHRRTTGLASVPPGLPFGTKVKAVVDYPSQSDCIRLGDTGTIYCYDPGDPILPYLVNWDPECGFEQCQVCGICAPHGWWVGFDEISQTCPIATLVSSARRLPEAKAKQRLAIARAFRDNIMSQTEAGRNFTGLYYKHAAEIDGILAENRSLRFRSAFLFFGTLPAVKRAIDNNGKLVLRARKLARIERLLDEYQTLASPELSEAIEEVRLFLDLNRQQLGPNWVRIDLKE
jgi:hypothetical protein